MNQTKLGLNNNSRGSLLKEMEADSDSDVPEFSLPPKSVVKRPRKSIKKRTRSRWRKLCRNFCRYCGGVVLVLVLTACVLSISLLFWFSLRLYRDVENLSRRLTIEINRVQAEEAENFQRCDVLKKKMEENLQTFHNTQKDVEDIKRKLHISFSKIEVVNNTLLKMTNQLHDGKNKLTLHGTVDALQKGMAYTDAAITKLGDDVKEMRILTTSHSSAIRRILSGLSNISHELANMTGKSEEVYDPVQYLLGPLNDEKDAKSHKEQNLKKSSFFKRKDSRDVAAMVSAVNHSLFYKIKGLQSQVAELKMKTNDENLGLDSVNSRLPADNLSKTVFEVQSDVSSIQYLLSNLNTRIVNLTRYNMQLTDVEKQMGEKININVQEIKFLWDELGRQNDSLFNIQRTLPKEFEYGSEFLDEAETTERTQTAKNSGMFSKPVDHELSLERKRDLFNKRKKRKFRNYKYKSNSKDSDIYSDLVNENR